MQQRLADYDVMSWVNDFLEQLANVKKEQGKLKVKMLEPKTVLKIKRGLSKGK